MLFGQKPSRRKKASEFTTLVIGEFSVVEKQKCIH